MKQLFPNDQAFLRRSFMLFCITLGALLIIWFVWAAVDGLLLVFFAILVAVALDGLARLLRAVVAITRHVAVMIVATTIALVLGVGLVFGGLNVAAQAPQLERQIAQSVDNLSGWMQSNRFAQKLVDNSNAGNGSSSSPSVGPGERIIGDLSNVATVTVSSLADIFVIVIIGLYLALQPSLYQDGLLRLFPPAQEAQVIDISSSIVDALRRWLMGRGISMAVVAIGSVVGLWLIGIPFALLLGLLAGLLTFVPYLGPIVSAVPALFVAGLDGPSTVFYVGALYLGLHILEGYILVPLIQKRAVSIAPGFLLIAQVLGAAVAGVMGIMLAAPVALVLVVIVQIGYVRNVLGHRPHLPGHPQVAEEQTQ